MFFAQTQKCIETRFILKFEIETLEMFITNRFISIFIEMYFFLYVYQIKCFILKKKQTGTYPLILQLPDSLIFITHIILIFTYLGIFIMNYMYTRKNGHPTSIKLIIIIFLSCVECYMIRDFIGLKEQIVDFIILYFYNTTVDEVWRTKQRTDHQNTVQIIGSIRVRVYGPY